MLNWLSRIACLRLACTAWSDWAELIASQAVVKRAIGAIQVVQEQSLEDPLYVVDLGALSRLYQAWVKLMPRVTPYYAVKCNTGRPA